MTTHPHTFKSRLARVVAALAVCATGATLVAPAPAAHAVINGVDTQAAELPFLVYLQNMRPIDRTDYQRFICAGTLLRPNVVLTAASCVYNRTRAGASIPSDIDVIVGASRSTNAAEGERLDTAAVFVHPGWTGRAVDGNDVALIRTTTASTRGTPLRLARTDESPRWAAGATIVLAGWGSETPDVASPTFGLQKAVVPVQSDLTTYEYLPYIRPDQQFGAGDLDGSPGACHRDEGAPLFFRTSDGFAQAGVMTYGIGCEAPSLFSDVGTGALRAWIDQMFSPPAASIGDVTTYEGYRVTSVPCTSNCIGGHTARFTIRLSHPTVFNVTVRYRTANGTATSPADYTYRDSSTTANGIATVGIPVVRDNTTEPTETFTVNLVSAVNATIVDGRGVGTILNGTEEI